jgi:peptidoglycan/LPS O-acetylase OafA/YrhL
MLYYTQAKSFFARGGMCMKKWIRNKKKKPTDRLSALLGILWFCGAFNIITGIQGVQNGQSGAWACLLSGVALVAVALYLRKKNPRPADDTEQEALPEEIALTNTDEIIAAEDTQPKE